MTDKALRQRSPVIAIDGPAGAGKSTLATHLARRFGLLHLETGAMYRAFALKAILSSVSLDAEAGLMQLATDTRIELRPQPEGNRVWLDGADVSDRVRQGDVTVAASQVSVHSAVRNWMVEQQRALGAAGGVVMEGRDIGTVVFPRAEVKLFLDASPEVRGERRFQQTGGAAEGDGSSTPSEVKNQVIRELRERDERDRSRAESPLRPAEDAILLDSTGMTLPQVLRRCEELVATYFAQV